VLADLHEYGTKMHNLLGPLDQTMFDLGRATGVTGLIQAAWVYNRTIDIEGVRKFHDHLQRGRLSRRIERSPLSFGRHRWVAPDGSPGLEIVTSARPREDFDAWLNEQARIPLDCERGPGWHLAVLPFTEGGAGVSLLVPHCITDGLGLFEALADAALGRDDPIRWPAAGSRTRWQAAREDAYQTARDARAIGRAVAAAVRVARRGRTAAGPLATTTPALGGTDEPIMLPTATVFVDADEWESRAHALGGTSNTLLGGLAARLAERRGRLTADGLVDLRIPVSDRTAGDTRGNAVSNVDVTVDPAAATTDLREIRAAIKQALIRHQAVPDDERAMLPMVPLLPKRLVRVTGSATSVISTNLGVADPAVTRADGTDADYFAARLLYQGVTHALMHRLGGLQVLPSGRAQGRVFVSAIAYQPGGPNSNDGLRHDLSSVLKDFSLTGTHL
jgi:diacylglycerol O-acyltransferase